MTSYGTDAQYLLPKGARSVPETVMNPDVHQTGKLTVVMIKHNYTQIATAVEVKLIQPHTGFYDISTRYCIAAAKCFAAGPNSHPASGVVPAAFPVNVIACE